MSRWATATEAYHLASQQVPKFAERAHALFVHNEWKWSQLDGHRIPTVQEISAAAENLLWTAYRELNKRLLGDTQGYSVDFSCVSSGRLQARLSKYPSGWIASIEVMPLSLQS